jgi:tetratricopeptide (TPR) repeat protein
VPFERNPRFTGRESQLAELEGMLFTGDRTAKIAITGLGGVGKTQLVLELLYRTKDKHKHCLIIWIPATSGESLHQAYRDVARQLRIPGWEEEKADVKKLVQGHLSKDDAGQWLVVFDNADDIDMWITKAGSKQESEQGSRCLVDYLPSSDQGSIIFTTRDRKTATKLAHQNVVEIREMDEVAATQLLQKCLIKPDLVNNRQDTAVLLGELTYLPLAIAQAAAYINENGITLGCYLSLLAEQEEEVIALLSEEFEDDGRYRDVKNPVATTWLISFEQIQQSNPLAAQYLSFMSCVAPKEIPQSLLPPGSSRKEETDAIGTLNAYSFVSRRPADPVLDLHRLVHLATRNWLRKERKLAQWTERVIVRLEEVFPDDNHKNRSVWRRYLPHARYALQADLVDKDWTCRIDLIWRYGLCLYRDGQWGEAEVAILQVLETEKMVLGPDHPSTLVSMANLASIYWNQGRWNEAEKLEVQVMEIRKAVLGIEHPDTLTSMANLASTYHIQGRWDEAEKLGMQVMETSKAVLGAEHPNTLTSMANLATTYSNQGRSNEAEKLVVQVIERRKTVLGAEHPNTLTSMANLATTYRNQGRLNEAEKLGMQVMETSKAVLGAEHPNTLTSMANLATTYSNQGRLNEAEKLGMQVMEIRKKLLGAEHPDTLISMGNLASTYYNQGRWNEAEKLEVQVMEIGKAVLGAEHPNTLTSMANLAYTWKSQRRLADALALLEACYRLRKKVLGPDHPDTRDSFHALGIWRDQHDLLLNETSHPQTMRTSAGG